ncbi:MAG: DUF3782 domain-containing protein [Deltaproteobacteria bacterium]|nr:DUF3782 domain-containing protein [Deltaproteobacteria bacterium]
MANSEFIEQLRTELPKLLRERPEVRHELWGIMLEAFPSRQEFLALVEELRAAREDSNRRFEDLRQDMNRRFEELRQDMNSRFEVVDRRFEAVDRRFEAVDRRFEAVITELRHHSEELRYLRREVREVRVGMSSLGDRVGRGLEGVLREVIEEFAGETFPFAERLVLRDEAGEVYGVTGADVEFDLYVHNDKTACLVEAKSYLKPGDVLMFHRKVRFAERKLGRPVTPLILALSAAPRAEEQARALGIRCRLGVVAAVEAEQ